MAPRSTGRGRCLPIAGHGPDRTGRSARRPAARPQRRDPGPRRPPPTPPTPHGPGGDHHRCARRGVPTGVRGQVGGDLAEPVVVTDHHHRVRRVQRHGRPGRPPGGRRRCRRRCGEVERVGSEGAGRAVVARPPPVAIRRPHASRRPRSSSSSTSPPIRRASASIRVMAMRRSSGRSASPRSEQLGVATDRRQRGGQLVGRVGDEAAQVGFGGVTPGEGGGDAARAWR